MPNIVEFSRFKKTENELSKIIASDGEPPDNGKMEARVTRIETIIQTLATKEDLAKMDGGLRSEVSSLETRMHKEFHNMTWKLLGGASALVTAVYFIAINTK